MSSDPLIFRTLTIPRDAIVSYRKLARLPVPQTWIRYEFFGDGSVDEMDCYLCGLITGSWHSTVRWDHYRSAHRHVVYFEREDDSVLFVLSGGADAIAKND